jgi:hypothetical protein
MGCWHVRGPWHCCGGPGYCCGPGPCVDCDYEYGYEYGPRFRVSRRPRSEDLEGYLEQLEAELARVKAELAALRRGPEARL